MKINEFIERSLEWRLYKMSIKEPSPALYAALCGLLLCIASIVFIQSVQLTRQNPAKLYTVIQNGVKIEHLKYEGYTNNTHTYLNTEGKKVLFEGTYTIIEE